MRACVRRGTAQRGITLLEMLIVLSIIAIMVAVAYPSLATGIDTLRLRSSADAIAATLNGALTRADRKQVALEVRLLPQEGRLVVAGVEPGNQREVLLAEGVRISAITPALPQADPAAPRTLLLVPGGIVPRLTVELTNARGARRRVEVDPITSTARIITPGQEEQP